VWGAEPDRHGADGVPTWVSVDHQPDAEDDEECYRVSGFRALDEGGPDPS
jgi:hypothetical protein